MTMQQTTNQRGSHTKFHGSAPSPRAAGPRVRLRKIASACPFLMVALGAGLVLPTSLSGCTAIAGIEKREKDPNAGDGFTTTDVETEIRTTELCVEYCNEVGQNCTEDLKVYLSRESCLNTCNALPPGDPAEPLGNTVECRLVRAKAAGMSPDEECVSAGPGGGQACGSNCEAYCQLLESECPDDFAGLRNCEASCEALPDPGDFNVDENYTANTLQCRLIHLGAVGQDKQESIHCTHARYIPMDTCVDQELQDPDCDSYCDVVGANCGPDEVTGDDLSVYESRENCLAACDAMVVGTAEDITPNTVGCRIYHATAAAGDPATHCDHASPAGDGNCGTYDLEEDGITGNCESYCRYLEAGCSDEFAAAGYANVQECAEECAVEFDGRGAERNSFYSVETAREEDGLQCRIYYSVQALAGQDSACALAAPDSTCR